MAFENPILLQLVGVGSTPEEFEKLVRSDITALNKLIAAAGITIE